MASINDVFSQPEPGESIIKFNLPENKSEFLARLVEAGFPFAAFLKEFHDNPEGPVTSSIDKEAQNWPFYSSLIKPLLKGEKPDFEMAAKEFALAGSQPGGPAKALGALPIKLNKSGQRYIVRPESMAEIHKLQSTLREAVKKGEITKADADKLVINAMSNLENQARLESLASEGRFDLDNARQTLTDKPIEKTKVDASESKKYDDAYGVGNWLGHNIKGKAFGRDNNGNIVYLKGDNGPLWINEHTADANMTRHKLSNYDELIDPVNKSLHKLHPSGTGIAPLKLKEGKNVNLYKTVTEPQAMNQVKPGELGYNYRTSMNKSVNEGRKATTESPNYKTVDELYKIILGLD